MSEARQINNPYYNMHRLGFFMTPTPRNADVLMVSGPVSDAMRLPLRKTYDAMPDPKRVVAIGACAISVGSSDRHSQLPAAPRKSFRSTSWFLAARRRRWRSCMRCCLSSNESRHRHRPRRRPRASRSRDEHDRPALFDVFYSLRRWRGHCVSYSGAMEPRPSCDNCLAGLDPLLASARLLIGDFPFHATLWTVLSLGTLSLAADRLSAIFLFVTALVFVPVSIFSGVYLTKYAATCSLRYFSILYHGLFASIVLVLIADDAISFLIAWEMMSIVAYLLVNFEHEHQESSHAGFVMLAMSEAGTIAVVMAFVLLASAAGTLEFDKLRSGPGPDH